MPEQNLESLINQAQGFFEHKTYWKNKITTTKLRNILSKVQELYDDLNLSQESLLSDSEQQRIQIIRVRIVFECGRDKDLKEFIEVSGVLKMFNAIGDCKESYLKLCHYLEALVAYHRFYGGKD